MQCCRSTDLAVATATSSSLPSPSPLQQVRHPTPHSARTRCRAAEPKCCCCEALREHAVMLAGRGADAKPNIMTLPTQAACMPLPLRILIPLSDTKPPSKNFCHGHCHRAGPSTGSPIASKRSSGRSKRTNAGQPWSSSQTSGPASAHWDWSSPLAAL